jgi:hypothetical protein
MARLSTSVAAEAIQRVNVEPSHGTQSLLMLHEGGKVASR